MKNIHIIPTGKLSIIGYDGVKNLHFVNDFIDDYQQIFITSDEEIKEGDWIYSFADNKIYKIVYSKNNIIQSFYHSHYLNESKKIILTTDLELQKDGVQAIEDEFLEWFVKNPSCESVEVSDYIKQIGWESDANGRDMILNKRFYEIIIPKEEPKQCDICKMAPRLEGTNKCESCYSVVRHFLEQDPEFKDNLLPDLRMKQETLEEAAEKFRSNNPGTMQGGNNTKILNAFKNGAKWQQERSYSEEEVWKLVNKLNQTLNIGSDLTLEEWFEQFKNK